MEQDPILPESSMPEAKEIILVPLTGRQYDYLRWLADQLSTEGERVSVEGAIQTIVAVSMAERKSSAANRALRPSP